MMKNIRNHEESAQNASHVEKCAGYQSTHFLSHFIFCFFCFFASLDVKGRPTNKMRAIKCFKEIAENEQKKKEK